MKLSIWSLILASVLAAVSAAFYVVQILVFGKPHDTFFYLMQDLAFLPVQVLLVTLILNELLARRERRQRLHKMNMVIGAFFSEVGSELISALSQFDPGFAALSETARPAAGWSGADFRAARERLKSFRPALDARRSDLEPLRDALISRRGFILGLLENQNLLEHASFTNLLWAITHLAEELQFRGSLQGLPDSDLEHLSGDLKRVYSLLLEEWMSYAEHLRQDYPFMYSLLVRRNPFRREPAVVIDGGQASEG